MGLALNKRYRIEPIVTLLLLPRRDRSGVFSPTTGTFAARSSLCLTSIYNTITVTMPLKSFFFKLPFVMLFGATAPASAALSCSNNSRCAMPLSWVMKITSPPRRCAYREDMLVTTVMGLSYC